MRTLAALKRAPSTERLRIAMAMLSLAAGIAHAGVTAAHAEIVWWYGAAFASVAAAQLAWGVLLAVGRPGRRLLLAGAAGHATVLAAWVMARTVGLPLVPSAQSSAVGLLDVATAAFQALIVVGVLLTLRSGVWAQRPLRRIVGVTARLAAVLPVPLIALALLLAPPHEHSHADDDHSHSTDHRPSVGQHDGDHRH